MRTWADYEKQVRAVDPKAAQTFDEASNYVSMIYPMMQRRHELGFTVEQLANRARLSPETIRRVEGGGYNPSFQTLVKMSKALGLMLTVKDWEE